MMGRWLRVNIVATRVQQTRLGKPHCGASFPDASFYLLGLEKAPQPRKVRKRRRHGPSMPVAPNPMQECGCAPLREANNSVGNSLCLMQPVPDARITAACPHTPRTAGHGCALGGGGQRLRGQEHERRRHLHRAPPQLHLPGEGPLLRCVRAVCAGTAGGGWHGEGPALVQEGSRAGGALRTVRSRHRCTPYPHCVRCVYVCAHVGQRMECMQCMYWQCMGYCMHACAHTNTRTHGHAHSVQHGCCPQAGGMPGHLLHNRQAARHPTSLGAAAVLNAVCVSVRACVRMHACSTPCTARFRHRCGRCTQ